VDLTFKLIDTDAVTWNVTVNASGVLTTYTASFGTGVPSTTIPGTDGSSWTLSINTSGALITSPV